MGDIDAGGTDGDAAVRPDSVATPDAGRPDATASVDAGVDAGRGEDSGTASPPELSVEVEYDSAHPLRALLRIDASEPVALTVDLVGPGRGQFIARDEARSAHEVRILLLQENASYTATVRAYTAGGRTASAVVPFETESLPFDFQSRVSVLVDEHARDPGLTLFPIDGRRAQFVAVDRTGKIVWFYQAFDEPGGGLVAAVIRPLPDGTLMLLLAEEIRIIDTWGRTVRSFFETEEVGLPFHHDAVTLPNGGALVLSAEVRDYYVEPLDEEREVLGDTVVEFDATGAGVGRWSGFDTLDPLRYPGPESITLAGDFIDWSHANGLYHRESDDSHLISVRNQNWVVKVDRPTHEVDWILGAEGDFQLAMGEWFTTQHASEWVGDQVVIYDNGNERVPPSSRAVAYQVDETNMFATEVFSWTIPFYTPFVGDVDRLDAGWLVTAGGARAPERATLYEIDDSGRIIWQLELSDNVIYRSERVRTLEAPP